MAKSPELGPPERLPGQVEKSPQDDCVGSVPFDYRLLEDSGCAPDAGSNVPAQDLKNEPEPTSETQVPAFQNEELCKSTTTQLTSHEAYARTPKDDAILPDQCKGLLCRKAVRLTTLKWINERFANGESFKRVSEKFIDSFESIVQEELWLAVQKHLSPLAGPTVKEYVWTQPIIPNSNTASSAPQA